MEKSGLSAQGFLEKKNGTYMNMKRQKLYVKPIPSYVKLSDFIQVEVDLEKRVELSKRKAK